MAGFGIFGTIVKDIEVGAVKAWHVIELVGHDADVLFIDTLKAAQLLGIDKAHLLAAVERAKVATETYVEGKLPQWTAETVAVLQHEFVASSLVQKFGLAPAIATTITTIVSKLFASGSSKLVALIEEAVKVAEVQSGIVQ